MIHYEDERVLLHHADCLDVLRSMADNSVDAVVTDPPYGLSNTDPKHVTEAITRWCTGDREFVPDGAGFMGHAWDAFVPPPAVWDECLRVLKPGGHALVFSSSRTTDLMTLSLRLAGFEIRDSIAWLYGGAMPKSLDVGKAIDKRPGVTQHAAFVAHLIERRTATGLSRADVSEKVVGTRSGACWNWEHHQFPEARHWPALRDLLDMDEAKWGQVIAEADREVTGHGSRGAPRIKFNPKPGTYDVTTSATDAAKQWQGWGTGLRPSMELVCVARKPIEGTVAACVQQWGTGALNIDASRIGSELIVTQHTTRPCGDSVVGRGAVNNGGRSSHAGRWPANVVLDDTTAALLDEDSGGRSYNPAGQFGTVPLDKKEKPDHIYGAGIGRGPGDGFFGYGDSGGASRYFPVFKYQAKAPQRERPSYTDDTGRKIAHSTVKPLGFMRWLVRLVTQPGGLILDPFAGSGSTLEAAMLEGFRSIGVEQSAEYLPLIMIRVERANAADTGLFTAPASKGRWPANVAMDKDTASALDEDSGNLGHASSVNRNRSGVKTNNVYGTVNKPTTDFDYGDSGGASRFFPVFDNDEPAPDEPTEPEPPKGRWPANVAMDRDTAAELDEENGIRPGSHTQRQLSPAKAGMFGLLGCGPKPEYNDMGGPSKFFPVFDTDEPDALFEVS